MSQTGNAAGKKIVKGAECGRERLCSIFWGRKPLGVLTHVRFKRWGEGQIGISISVLCILPRFHGSRAIKSLSGEKSRHTHICSHISGEMTSINCPDEETAFQDAIYLLHLQTHLIYKKMRPLSRWLVTPRRCKNTPVYYCVFLYY